MTADLRIHDVPRHLDSYSSSTAVTEEEIKPSMRHAHKMSSPLKLVELAQCGDEEVSTIITMRRTKQEARGYEKV